MAYVYRYTDLKDNKIKYVGIVWSENRTLAQRLNEHLKLDDWCNNNYKIEYLKVANRTEAESLESHFIALYKTYKFYNNAKADWGINSFIPDMEDNWIEFNAKNLNYKLKNGERILYDIWVSSRYSIYSSVCVNEHTVYQYKQGIWKYSDGRKKNDLFYEKNLDKSDSNWHIYTFDKNKVQYYLNVFKNNAEVNKKKRINELHKSAETFIREYEKYYRLYAS